jgi:hypothetical protein
MLINATAVQCVPPNALSMPYMEPDFSHTLLWRKNVLAAVSVLIYVSSVQSMLNKLYALYNTGK